MVYRVNVANDNENKVRFALPRELMDRYGGAELVAIGSGTHNAVMRRIAAINGDDLPPASTAIPKRVHIYTKDEWNDVLERMGEDAVQVPQGLPKPRIHTQGRFYLPVGSAGHAGIEPGMPIAIVEENNHFEVWPEAEYDAVAQWKATASLAK